MNLDNIRLSMYPTGDLKLQYAIPEGVLVVVGKLGSKPTSVMLAPNPLTGDPPFFQKCLTAEMAILNQLQDQRVKHMREIMLKEKKK